MDELEEAMRSKTDEELYLLLRLHSNEYSPEAVKTASEEFGRRKLDETTMSQIMAAAERMMDGLPNGLRGFVEGFRHGWATAAEQQGNPARKPLSDDLKETAGGWGCLILLCFVGYAIYGGYQWLDSIGWITHSHDTPVWIAGNWMVGEYRNCGMLTTTSTRKPDVQAELPRLFCSDHGEGLAEFERKFMNLDDPRDFEAAREALWYEGDWRGLDSRFHVLPVQYHGRINRPDKALIEWRCQRLNASLECKAVD
jgi:hypothetical protein